MPGGEADAATADSPWDELVTAALLGAERRIPPGGSAPAMLGLAAVETVRYRAGLTPAPAGALPEEAAEDTRPPLPRAAADRLTQLLKAVLRTGYDGSSGGAWAGPRADLGALLPEWLELADARGYRPRPDQLPALLGAARARSHLRPAALAFAGPRGRWLAGLNPEWQFALRSVGTGPAEAVPADPATVQSLWEEGLFTERVALLTGLRRLRPAAGRELLAADWSKERPEDRLIFLDLLRDGLSAADEEFLEAALADRSKTVRATAAELLSLLPGSALSERMSQRARSSIALDLTGRAPRLTVEAPYECDAAMRRDGVVAKPPMGHGERAWWLTQIVEAAPLAGWSDHLRGRSAAEIVALPVADDWRANLHVAWSRAAVRQQNTEWALALLGRPAAPVAETPERSAKLLQLLPAEQRAEWAVEFIVQQGLGDAGRVLGSCSSPWPPALAETVLTGLRRAARERGYPSAYSGVLSLAARGLDPAEAGGLLPLVEEQSPDEGSGRSRDRATYWAHAIQQLADTLRLRAAIRAELRA